MADETSTMGGDAVVARMRQSLPEMLRAVRWRRRRRRTALAGVGLAVAILVAWPWWPRASTSPTPTPPIPVASTVAIVGDDASVLSRCEVHDRQRPEWRLDDDGLRAQLLALGKPAGLVRVAGRVLVDRRVLADAGPAP